jgi:hypothetical protein
MKREESTGLRPGAARLRNSGGAMRLFSLVTGGVVVMSGSATQEMPICVAMTPSPASRSGLPAEGSQS